MGVVTVGLDPGQRRDHTAIGVVETDDRLSASGRIETHFLVRHLERVKLGTTYPLVAERVAEVCRGIVARTGVRPTLYVDATGVGTPVLDVLRAGEVPAELVGVFFTHGDRRTVVDGEIRLGKAFMVSRLQALLQGLRLHLPRTAEAEACGRELLDYEIRVDEDANDKYGAFKVGKHDDLVTAIGLATQVEPGPPAYEASVEREAFERPRHAFWRDRAGW